MDRFNSISRLEVPDEHPIKLVDQFWSAQASEHGHVSWSTFDPVKMVSVLPWMMLLDCLPDEEYRYRLCGSGCENLLRLNQTGKLFGDNVNKNWANESKREFMALKQKNGPFYSTGSLPVEDRDFIKVHRAVYGFCVKGSEVDRIMAVVAPTEKRWREITT